MSPIARTMSPGSPPLATILDSRMVRDRSSEKPLLIALFFMIYIAYGGLGRDVFYNSYATGQVGDPIGAVLPYARLGICLLTVLFVTASAGLTWAASKIPLLFAPFVALALASTLWSELWKNTFQYALTFAAMWVALSMLIHRMGLVQTVRSSVHLVAAVLIASAFMAIFIPSIGQHSSYELSGVSHAGRWRGIFQHKNGLGPWAAYGSVFLFSHSWLCSGPRLYFWLARACAVACLVMSGSVTALITAAFLVGCLIFFALLRRYRLSVVIAASVLVAPVGLALLLQVYDFLLNVVERDATLTGRTDIWAIAWSYFWEKAWLGNGYQSLGGPDFLARVEQLFLQAIPGPESGYLTMLLDLGMVGAVLYLVPYLLSVRNGFEWLKHVERPDRAAIEFILMIVMSTAIYAITETSSMICTGFAGTIAYGGFFALLTMPRSPDSRLRGEFRLARHQPGLTA